MGSVSCNTILVSTSSVLYTGGGRSPKLTELLLTKFSVFTTVTGLGLDKAAIGLPRSRNSLSSVWMSPNAVSRNKNEAKK